MLYFIEFLGPKGWEVQAEFDHFADAMKAFELEVNESKWDVDGWRITAKYC